MLLLRMDILSPPPRTGSFKSGRDFLADDTGGILSL
jgi:hypothetical protein